MSGRSLGDVARTTLRDNARLIGAVGVGALGVGLVRHDWLPFAANVAAAVAAGGAMTLAARIHNAARGLAELDAGALTPPKDGADAVATALKDRRGAWSGLVEALFLMTYAALAFASVARFFIA